MRTTFTCVPTVQVGCFGQTGLVLILHSSNKPGELWQWDDITTNILKIIIII